MSDEDDDEIVAIPLRQSRLIVAKDPADFDVWFMHTGPGMCNVVLCAELPTAVIFDCGTTSRRKANQATYVDNVLQVLGDNNIKELSIVLSHGDRDHYDLLPEIVRQWRDVGTNNIGGIFYGGQLDEYDPSVQSLITEYAGERPSAPRLVENPTSCPNSSIFFAVASPAPGKKDSWGRVIDKNQRSMVAAFRYRNIRIVFAGDATQETEGAAMENDQAAAIDDGDERELQGATVVVASHHGAESYESNSQGYVAYTAPSYVIYESGQLHMHPTETTVDRYRSVIISDAPAHAFSYGGRGGPASTSTRGEYNTHCNGNIRLSSSDGSTVTITPDYTDYCQ